MGVGAAVAPPLPSDAPSQPAPTLPAPPSPKPTVPAISMTAALKDVGAVSPSCPSLTPLCPAAHLRSTSPELRLRSL